MDKHFLKAAVAFAAVMAFTACSEAPTTETKTEEAKKEPPAPVEPVLAKTAFYEMYRPARAWANDVELLSMTSGEIEGFKIADGKAPLWTCVFVSQSKGEARTATYAIADHTPIQKGVTLAGSERWSGAGAKLQPFPSTDFQINSDAAYQTAAAQPKAQAFLKEHPNKPLSFFLGKQAKFPAAAWYVLWGDTKMGYAVYVNALTGDVMK